MAEATALRISSEDEAWEYLRRALEGELPEGLVPAVEFKGWPLLDVYLPNTEVESSISPSMMRAFVDFQDAIYRSHALVVSGEANARTLSAAERERLEIRVKVSGGSSGYKADLSHIADTLGVAAIGKMTPEEIMIVIIGLILTVGSVTAWALWLKHRTATRKAEVEERGKELLFDAFNKLTQQDTERQKLWLRAQTAAPVLAQVSEQIDAARTEVLKALADEGGGKVDGLDIDSGHARDLTTNARKKAEQTTVRATYRVAKVDTTSADGFRVTLRDLATSEEITASLQDAIISDIHRQRIREAEWSKRPVIVELAIRRSRTRIVEAVVVDVQDAPRPAATA